MSNIYNTRIQRVESHKAVVIGLLNLSITPLKGQTLNWTDGLSYTISSIHWDIVTGDRSMCVITIEPYELSPNPVVDVSSFARYVLGLSNITSSVREQIRSKYIQSFGSL